MWGVMCVCVTRLTWGAPWGVPHVLRGGCGGGCTVGVLPGRGDPVVSPVPPPGCDSARPDTLITLRTVSPPGDAGGRIGGTVTTPGSPGPRDLRAHQ